MTFTDRVRRTGTCLLAGTAALTLGSPTAWAAGTLTSTRPALATARAGLLSGVSCSSATFCVAVGTPGDISSLVMTWNGSAWQKQSLPDAGKQIRPLAVSCLSPDFCDAAGFKPTASDATLIINWNGARWATQPSPHFNGELMGVSCASTTACLAVGETEALPSGVLHPLAERWDGQRWSPVHVVAPSGVSGNLDAVSCSSSTACTVGGGYFDFTSQTYTPLLERWNGSKLMSQQPAQPTSPDPSNIAGVACPGANGCIAVGNIGREAIVQSWNGTTWTQMSTPVSDGTLAGVSCTAITACTVAGVTSSGPLAERLSGTSWRVQSVPQPPGSLSAEFLAVSCPLTTDCTAAGLYSTSPEQDSSLAEHWNGSHWMVQPTPTPGGERARPYPGRRGRMDTQQ